MNKDHVIRKEDYSDEKYQILSFNGEKNSFKRAVSLNESICILPFDTNENGQIKNVYLHSFYDHVLDQPNHKCITKTLLPDDFDTYHDSLISCINEDLGIGKIEPNDLYYLGKIQHGSPFHKTYKTYALNLNPYCEEPNGYSFQNPSGKHSLSKVKISRVANGDICDSLVLSCALLLFSYISE